MQFVDPGESDTVGLMFLQIPGFGSRDMNDAVVEQHGGEDWIRFGDTLFRPLDGVPELADGANTVTFGAEGYAEWRALPVAANVGISAGTAWRLCDADMTVVAGGTTFPATVDASTGSYLVLFGPANSSTAVTVTPSAGGQSARPAPVMRHHFTIPGRRPSLPPSPNVAAALR